MMRWYWHMTVLFLVIVSCVAFAQDSKQCSDACLVTIKGILPKYNSGTRAEITLQNASSQKLNVNTAIEAFEGGSWREVAGSISDPKNSFAKIVKLTPLNSGASAVVRFNPCKTTMMVGSEAGPQVIDHPCSSAQSSKMPTRFRLRVDVFDIHGKKLQVINSQEFTLA
jgi:hypothetical protein